MTPEEKVDRLLDKWCDCVNNKASINRQEASSQCMQDVRIELESVLGLLNNKVSESVTKTQDSTLYKLVKSQEERSLKIFKNLMREKGMSCLEENGTSKVYLPND